MTDVILVPLGGEREGEVIRLRTEETGATRLESGIVVTTHFPLLVNPAHEARVSGYKSSMDLSAGSRYGIWS